ncbi:MAG: sigma-70 family RNA polymerase sigma factor [Bacteroidales bacterium]|nr:sigma-70 family RNA polymerase sigma factor [Bacteroidales bacterium]
MDLKDIVRGCRSAEPESIKALYDLYSGKLMKKCLFYVRSQDEAHDLFHDSFLIIISKIGQLKDPMRLEAWMNSIVRNLALQYLKERNKLVPETEIPEMADEEENQAYEPVSSEVLISMINTLPGQYGKVFRMSVLDGLSHKEIGEILGIEERTSSSDLFRARAVLKDALKKYWGGILVLLLISMFPFLLKEQESGHDIADVINIIGTEDSAMVADTTHPVRKRPAEMPQEAMLTGTELMIGHDSVSMQIDTAHIVQDTVSIEPKVTKTIKEEAKEYHAWEDTGWKVDKRRPSRMKASVRLHFSNIPGSMSADYSMSPDKGLLADLLPENDFTSAATKIDSWSDLEKIMADLAQNYPDSTMYSSLHSIAMSNAAAGNEMKEEREYARPLTVGMTASIGLDRKWSIITGLEYTRLSSRARSGIDTVSVSNRQTIHYLGIPAGAAYSIWCKDKMNLSISAYGRIDIPVAASSIIEHHNGNIVTYSSKAPLKVPVQWSVGTGLCFQYILGNDISIYIEPQLQYHFDTGGNVTTTWTERPVDFAIPVGIRFSW